MVWTVIPDSDIDPDSPVTTGLMTALRDNTTAQANGDSGAPKNADASFSTNSINGNKLVSNTVGQSQIGSNAVGQSELKTTTSDQSVSIAVSSDSFISVTGGRNSMGLFRDGSDNFIADRIYMGSSTRVGFRNNTSGSSKTAYVYSSYVQASPPYNLGDGDIPLFVYVEVENVTGKPLSISVAPEASWHYNGDTDIVASRKEGARSWKEVPQIISDLNDANMTKQESVRLGIYTREEIASRLISDPKTEIELTQGIKNADMNVVPHPYVGRSMRNSTMVMFDPVSSKTEMLLKMHDDGEKILKLIEDGKIQFGNTALDRVMPNGIIAVDFNL